MFCNLIVIQSHSLESVMVQGTPTQAHKVDVSNLGCVKTPRVMLLAAPPIGLVQDRTKLLIVP